MGRGIHLALMGRIREKHINLGARQTKRHIHTGCPKSRRCMRWINHHIHSRVTFVKFRNASVAQCARSILIALRAHIHIFITSSSDRARAFVIRNTVSARAPSVHFFATHMPHKWNVARDVCSCLL